MFIDGNLEYIYIYTFSSYDILFRSCVLDFIDIIAIFFLLSTATTRINLARGKPASQSSDHNKAYAQRAVDGNRDPVFDRDSCTHTTVMDAPWWRVDLEGVASVLFNI